MYIVAYSLIIGLTLFYFNIFGLYKYQILLNPFLQTSRLLKSQLYGIISVIFLLFLIKYSTIIQSRVLLIWILILQITFFFLLRVFLVPRFYYWLVRTKKIRQNILIVGAGVCGQKIASNLKQNQKTHFNVIGFIDDDTTKQNIFINKIKVWGGMNDIKSLILDLGIDHVFIAINNVPFDTLMNIINECENLDKTIHVISDLYSIIPDKLEIEEIGGIKAFRYNNACESNYYGVIKRFFDVSISIIIIIIFSPIWVIIAILIKLCSKGPVFYRAEVIGKNEMNFNWFKFRSMYYNNDDSIHKELVKNVILNGNPGVKIINDNRTTPLGRFLRKYSLDEFPQLINVILGEMSLVGPRPKLPYELELMDEWQRKRFNIIPGMTGIMQIYGRGEVKFHEEIILDLYYKQHRSLLLDCEILIKTIPAILFRKTGL